MDFQELIRARYSCRAYEPTLVEREKLEMVLDAGRLAPTADNRQPFRLIVMKTGGREAELRRVYDKAWFVQAPLVIAVVSVPGEAWVRKQDGWNAGDVDAAIVMDHITLAAADIGLSTCWVCAFDPEAARAALGLPPEAVPVAFTPLGYPADQLREKKRKDLDHLLRRERW
jgi:nitroreductase